jgi:predicted secreted protein
MISYIFDKSGKVFLVILSFIFLQNPFSLYKDGYFNNPSCSINFLSASPSSPQQVGASITISGSASCDTGVRAIRFKVDGGIIYEIGAPSGNATWNTGGASAGNHTITIEAAGQGDNNWSYAASQSISFTLTSAPQQPTAVPQPQNPSCSINSLSASPSSPQQVGASITISGSASCDTGVRAIRFKVDGGIIYEIGAPSGNATWNTGGASAGNHTIMIEAAGQGDNNWSYAASQSISFTLTSAPQQPTAVPQPQNPSCSITSLSASPSSPQQVGASITISGSASCDTGVRAIRFKVDGGIIYEIGAPSGNATWITGGFSAGNHTITIEAAGQGDNNWSYAASQSISFTLTSVSQPQNNPSCSITSFSASPSSPQQIGASITISGSASCDTGVRAIRFKVDGNIINEVGASSGSTTWNTGGASAGNHTITIEAAGQGDNNWSYSASQSISYTLTSTSQPQNNPSCSITSLSASPSSPQQIGASITISGSASCDTGVRAIRFKVDGNIINEVGASSGSTTWNTGGTSAGNHTITIEAAGQGDNNWSNAASQSLNYTLTDVTRPPVINCSPNNQAVEYWYVTWTWDHLFWVVSTPHPHFFFKVTVSSGIPARNQNSQIGPIIVGYGGVQNDWNNYDKAGWQSGYQNAPQLSSNNEYVVRVDFTDSIKDILSNRINDKLRVCTIE